MDELRGFTAIAYDAISMFYRRGAWTLEPYTGRSGNTRWLLINSGPTVGSQWCESFEQAASMADAWDALFEVEAS